MHLSDLSHAKKSSCIKPPESVTLLREALQGLPEEGEAQGLVAEVFFAAGQLRSSWAPDSNLQDIQKPRMCLSSEFVSSFTHLFKMIERSEREIPTVKSVKSVGNFTPASKESLLIAHISKTHKITQPLSYHLKALEAA